MIDLDKYQELLTLLSEAYEHYFTYGDGIAKSSEGYVSLIVPPYYWEDDKLEVQVEIYSYVFGSSGRLHIFESLDAALSAVREWHQKEMKIDYCPGCHMDIERCFHSV